MTVRPSYIIFALLGFFASFLIQKWDHQSLYDVVVWLQNYYLYNSTTGCSIGLLTLVEHKKKSFSVAVLPSKEISTETGIILTVRCHLFFFFSSAIFYPNVISD